jgi:sialate O-acetylesterase
MKLKIFSIIISVFVIGIIQAQLKVAPIVSDNMVLQRNTDVKVWGTAQPNQSVSVFTSWNKNKTKVVANEKGEWIAKIKTTDAGGPFTITITAAKDIVKIKNILLGEVWLCSGQSNMEMPVLGYNNQPVNGSADALFNAGNDNIRLFKVKLVASPEPKTECEGAWVSANTETVGKFSAIGYFYAKMLQQKLKVPVGIVYSGWGGTRIEAWMKKEIVQQFPKPYELSTMDKLKGHNKAAYLYNGMILPITNYCIKGVLWYQGEGNIDYPKEYADLMAAMIEGWRVDFGIGQFPFYFVQLASYPYTWVNPKLVPMMRDQQTKASLSIPNVGMVTAIDHGDVVIHPAEKEIIAKRLAYLSLGRTYGLKGMLFESPTFKAIQIADTAAIVSFEHAELGLTSFGRDVECFEIAGKDSVYYPAQMKIIKEGIQVWSQQVKAPISVRYAYTSFPKTRGFLYNTAGLPVLPFKSDNWLK